MTFAFWRQIQKVSSLKPRIHLDYASATPVHPDVYSAMQPYFSDEWANPSAIYREGVQARAVIESARIELARTLRVKPSEITFTSGGTEANNLALIGVIEAERNAGREYIDMEIISTRIEHPSILETLAYLERKGVTIRYGSVDAEGCVDPEQVATLLSAKTILCTFGYVNAEIGVVQDIKKLTRMVRAWNETHHASVYVHTDASQAPLWLPCALDALGVDLMTLDAGKCYGPKGAGVLIHRATVSLQAVTHGGGQESRLRSGTENTALIVGCVRALVRAQASQVSRSQATAVLRDTFFDLLIKAIPGVMINGSRTARVANNVNISIPGIDTEYAVITLDAKGIAVSTRSACSAVGSAGSYVVREMTHDAGRAEKTLRCTLGESTSKEDIEYTVQVLRAHVAHMRSTTSLV